MATKKTTTPEATVDLTDATTGKQKTLASLLSTKAVHVEVDFWIVGDTPLITHAWSQKAKLQMLQKQVKAAKGTGKDPRDPQDDFVNSLYRMTGDEVYGFPATGVKNCILNAAHKDKGIARSGVLGSLWVHAEMVRSMPGLQGAICDMPLIRIYGSKPEMREDMVRIGSGQTKTSNLAYRAQFTVWAMKIKVKINTATLKPDQLAFLVHESGVSTGLGEWRIEKKGMFGSFHLAEAEEEDAWNAFAAGTGPMPIPASYSLAEAAE